MEESSGIQENADVIIPATQHNEEPTDLPDADSKEDELYDLRLSDNSIGDLSSLMETCFLTALHKHEKAKSEAPKELIEEQKAKGIDIVTPENALEKGTKFMNTVKNDFNLNKIVKKSIGKDHALLCEKIKTQDKIVKRLETIVGRTEKVHRPPFPTWACLA